MIEMAKNGLGQSYYGETAQDLLDPFKEEFELLQNIIATDISLDTYLTMATMTLPTTISSKRKVAPIR